MLILGRALRMEPTLLLVDEISEGLQPSVIERIAKVAFELARVRNNKVCSAEKSNVMESGLLWREVVTDLHRRDYLRNYLGELHHAIIEIEVEDAAWTTALPDAEAVVLRAATAALGTVEGDLVVLLTDGEAVYAHGQKFGTLDPTAPEGVVERPTLDWIVSADIPFTEMEGRVNLQVGSPEPVC